MIQWFKREVSLPTLSVLFLVAGVICMVMTTTNAGKSLTFLIFYILGHIVSYHRGAADHKRAYTRDPKTGRFTKRVK